MRRLGSEVWWEDFRTMEDNVQQEMFLLSSRYDRALSVLSNNLLGHLTHISRLNGLLRSEVFYETWPKDCREKKKKKAVK